MRTNTANIYKGREGGWEHQELFCFFSFSQWDGEGDKRKEGKKNKTLIGKERKIKISGQQQNWRQCRKRRKIKSNEKKT